MLPITFYNNVVVLQTGKGHVLLCNNSLACFNTFQDNIIEKFAYNSMAMELYIPKDPAISKTGLQQTMGQQTT